MPNTQSCKLRLTRDVSFIVAFRLIEADKRSWFQKHLLRYTSEQLTMCPSYHELSAIRQIKTALQLIQCSVDCMENCIYPLPLHKHDTIIGSSQLRNLVSWSTPIILHWIQLTMAMHLAVLARHYQLKLINCIQRAINNEPFNTQVVN